MDRLSGLLSSALRMAARLLPSARREWAAAVQAEASLVPAGWPRLDWLAGGLWLVVKEAEVARKIVYWLGIGALSVTVAWVIWLSWLNVPATDPEVGTDRIRTLVVAAALLGLPWVARRHGWFGPVGHGIAARLARLAGFAAICGMGITLVNLDRSAGQGGGIVNGGFSWIRDVAGLVMLGGLVAVPLLIRAKRPNVEASTLWSITGIFGVVVWAILPLQVLAAGYVAAILLATSRRFALPSAALVAGAVAGVVAGLIDYALISIPVDLGLLYVGITLIITLVTAVPAGAVCGWRVPGTEKTPELREARIRQGLLAGIVAGACNGLLMSNLVLFFFFLLVLGPAAGLVGGALGGGFAAAHPPKPRQEGSRVVGLFASGS